MLRIYARGFSAAGISAPGDPSTVFRAGNNQFIIEGQVYSEEYTAIGLGGSDVDGPFGTSNTVTVSETGTIVGALDGIRSVGGSDNIVNAGSIYGRVTGV